jgi:hypothetical protein
MGTVLAELDRRDEACDAFRRVYWVLLPSVRMPEGDVGRTDLPSIFPRRGR